MSVPNLAGMQGEGEGWKHVTVEVEVTVVVKITNDIHSCTFTYARTCSAIYNIRKCIKLIY